MSLAPGSRLGPYEIVAAVGAGGMGEVFKARDTRLDRTVALKILPSHVASDPALRERFEREARTVASLTHPHICTLHDVGRENGLEYLVLEFVEGETLAERLGRGALPMDVVLRVAIEMADALDRAHRAGIVHRDIKPANVMLTRSGVKLLDFGLAKLRPLVQPTAAATTATKELTQVGQIMGTLHYMSPEQLGGEDVDARTDIFALGAVIYEMATGRRAFDGATQASVIGAILHSHPAPPSTLQPLANRRLDHIVERCLAKDREDRWQTARDVLLELRPHAASEDAQQPVIRRDVGTDRWVIGAMGAALAVTLVGLAALLLRPAPRLPVVRAEITSPRNARFNFTGDFGGPPVLSADGRALAFVANEPGGVRRLWVRRLDAVEAVPLADTTGATFPFWSPDGRAIAFFAAGKLRRADADGSGVLTICDAPSGRGGTWSADGTILFTPTVRDGLYQVAATGGEPRVVTKLQAGREASHRWPTFLADGKTFVYLAVPDDPARRSESALLIASLDGGETKTLVRSTTQAEAVGEDVLFLRDGSLVRQRVDPGARALVGEPVVLAHGVQHDPTIWRGVFAGSAAGPLVYQLGDEGGRTTLTWFDRTGRALGTVGESSIFFDVNLSPDGQRVAVNRGDPADIWVYELARGTGTRITADPANESLPIWSPDGSRLLFAVAGQQGRGMLAEARADGTDSPRMVYSGELLEASSWSADGRFLLVKPGDLRRAPGDIYVMPYEDPAKAFPIASGPFAEYQGVFSPDGRWVTYVSNESGREEVYVSAFRPPQPGEPPGSAGEDPARPGRWQISVSGGVLPRWKRDGTELYYLAPNRRVMAAHVNGRGAAMVVARVEPLFQADPRPVGWLYDVSADGQRFLVNTIGESQDAPVVLVLNALAPQRR